MLAGMARQEHDDAVLAFFEASKTYMQRYVHYVESVQAAMLHAIAASAKWGADSKVSGLVSGAQGARMH
eukprot:13498795-Alexandrium_andersonii.AAC.1